MKNGKVWSGGEKKKGEDWQKENISLAIKKGRKEDSGNDRPVSLRSVPGIVVEQLILETIYRHVSNKKVIRSSLYGFPKGKSGWTNLISFRNEMTGLVDKGRAVDVPSRLSCTVGRIREGLGLLCRVSGSRQDVGLGEWLHGALLG